MTQITPKVREALLLALNAQDGRLVRVRGGFGRAGEPGAGVVTSRTANALQADGLVDFDQPMFPTTLRLTAHGITQAQQLVASTAKAGAA